jgi:hypothetical protein
MCNETGAATTSTGETARTTVGKIDVASPGFAYLQTARIWVTGPTRNSKLTRCVLDGGSQSSFVAKTLIDDLKLEVVDRRDLVISAFESRSCDSGPRRVRASAQRAYGKMPPYLSLPLKVLTPCALTPRSVTASLLWRRLAKYN